MITTPEIYEDRWAVLQNQPRTFDPEDGNFFGLLAALDAGWHIEPPAYARPRWGLLHMRGRKCITLSCGVGNL